jgi:hypothetical protein
MALIIRAVRAKKAPNLGLQRGFSLSGTLQERLFTGSRVLNEVVLGTPVNSSLGDLSSSYPSAARPPRRRRSGLYERG